MAKTKTGLAAVITTGVAFLFIFIAFVTPCWLKTDGKLEKARFQQLGLWEVCFDGFEDIRHWYDTQFYGCWWVFEEEYYIIHDILLPGFFIATQFFMTLSFTLLLIAGFLTAMYCCCSRYHDKYITLLFTIAADLLIAAVCALTAVLIFGCYGDSRDWMPNWEHNDLSWSFALAAVGSLLLFPAGGLFLTEARRARYRRLQETRDPSHGGSQQFHMDVRKGTHSSDI